MTPAQARELKAGDRVMYFDIDAEVIHVRQNGITVGYWGRGPKEGQFLKHRVAAAYLKRKACQV